MSTPTVLRTLFTSFVALALAAAPAVALGKHHGGGSHAGGGSHGGSRGGGGFHGGNKGGGFHFGGGHSGAKSSRSARSAAPRQKGGGSFSSFGGPANRANVNSEYFGGRSLGSNGRRNINGTFGRSPRTSETRAIATSTYAPTRNFGSNRPPSTSSASRSWFGDRQSPWTGKSRSTTFFNSNRPPNAASSRGSWSGQSQFSLANAPRSPSSFNANRPPNASSSPRGWSGQGQSSIASAPRPTSSFNSNRPPTSVPTPRNWPGQSQFSSANALRSASFFDRSGGTPKFGSSRFGNSSFGHSSLSHSRSRSNGSRLGSPRFGDAHQFDWGGTSFHQENSFGGGDLAFVPDLFGMALNFGAFGLRGLGLLGTGLNAFGPASLGLLGSALNGFGAGGLDSTSSGPGDFNVNAGQDSLPWGPSPDLVSGCKLCLAPVSCVENSCRSTPRPFWNSRPSQAIILPAIPPPRIKNDAPCLARCFTGKRSPARFSSGDRDSSGFQREVRAGQSQWPPEGGPYHSFGGVLSREL